MAHWPCAPPEALLAEPASPGAGVLPEHSRGPPTVLAETVGVTGPLLSSITASPLTELALTTTVPVSYMTLRGPETVSLLTVTPPVSRLMSAGPLTVSSLRVTGPLLLATDSGPTNAVPSMEVEA